MKIQSWHIQKGRSQVEFRGCIIFIWYSWCGQYKAFWVGLVISDNHFSQQYPGVVSLSVRFRNVFSLVNQLFCYRYWLKLDRKTALFAFRLRVSRKVLNLMMSVEFIIYRGTEVTQVKKPSKPESQIWPEVWYFGLISWKSIRVRDDDDYARFLAFSWSAESE